MSQTYLLGSKDTEITITDDSLIIETTTYAKLSSSPLYRIRWFTIQILFTFVLLLAAGALTYFYLYSVTIECARSSLDSDAVCNVTRNYYLKPNEILLSNEIIKEINTTRDGSTCRLDIVMVNNTVISPLSGFTNVYSSGQCYFPSLEPIEQLLITDGYNRTIQVGSETVTVADNAFTWVGIFIFTFLGIGGIWQMASEGFLIRTVFDKKKQIITMHYINMFNFYKNEYSFDDVRKIVFTATSNPDATAKDPYILLKNFKKAHIDIFGDNLEKNRVVEHIKQVLS